MNRQRDLFIVIVGCGRLGSYIANKLSLFGHNLVVIDINIAAFDALEAQFSGFQIEGDAVEFAILKQAKLEKADLVIATTERDNVNLMVAQIAKKIFKVPQVMARVFDPKSAQVYRDLGIEGICPITLAGDLILKSYAEPGDVAIKKDLL
jgi:trk system potassium uptake protein